MPTTLSFCTGEKIIGRANERHEVMAGEAAALPLPQKMGDSVYVVILYYREGVRPGEEVIYPPHFIVTVDASTGDIIKSTTCVPADFGVPRKPGSRTVGFGLDPEMSADVFWDLTDRFMDISSRVWEIYSTKITRLDSRNAKVIREYDSIYRRIAKKPLVPYYRAIAADFFRWLSTADEGQRFPAFRHNSLRF